MKVNETFVSVQGEGPYIGIPTFFVRLTGCNLTCPWCDTKYALYVGEEMSDEELIAAYNASGLEHICFTGGEPLLQVHDIVTLLKENHETFRNSTVSLETNGLRVNQLNSDWGLFNHIVISPKPGKNSEKVFSYLRSCDVNILNHVTFKFVVGWMCRDKIYEAFRHVFQLRKYFKYWQRMRVTFQPMAVVETDPVENYNWLKDEVTNLIKNINGKEEMWLYEVRILPQLHKVMKFDESERV